MRIFRWLGGIAIFVVLGFGAWVVFDQPEDEPASVELETATEVAVRTVKLIKTTLKKQVMAYGMAEPEPASEGKPAALAKLALPSSGLITEVRCVEGQRVKKGDLLVSLDARADQSRVDQAWAAVEFTTQEYERQKSLLKIDGASVKSVQSAENDLHKARLEVAAAETALALLQIEAPIAGVITRINVRQGEAADPALTAVELLDPVRLVLIVKIPAAVAAEIKPGQKAAVLRQGSTLSGEGVVSFVSPQVDPLSGAVEVRLSLSEEAKVRPGEWLEARIVSQEKKDVLAAPVESVTTTEETGPVIAVVEGDIARQIPVKTGLKDGGLIEVEGEGLAEGALIVTEGAYGLPQETKVRMIGP